MNASAWLTVLALAPPAAAASLWALPPLRRAMVAAAPFCAIPALLVALAGPLGGELYAPTIFLGLRLGLDETGRAFALLTALLWTAGGLYARVYLADDPRRSGFFGFHLLTLTGNLGLVLAADALSFYLFFTIMTFSAYGLVVHSGRPEALRAGRVYMVMAVLGEALLLSGLLLLTSPQVSLPFREVGGAYLAADAPGVVALLILAGFAVKAGVLPLHMWLPLAHPVAPTPASAVLSGAMIEAGLLGWVRLLPLGLPGQADLGALVMAVGLLTGLYGVAVGLTQRDPKTLLAYSSVSQMGYMAVAVGLGLGSPPEQLPVVLLAVGLYALHHAIAKGALFLAVGVAPAPSLPPVWRRIAWIGAWVPALALAGAPLTTGALAKLALKHGLAAVPPAWPWPLDLGLALGTVATTLLMARFLAVLPSASPTLPGWQPARGLWLPWAMLVVPSLFGPLWLPWIYPAPVGIALNPLEELVVGLWPVLVGAALAAGVWQFRQHMPQWFRVAIPAGDLLVPLSRLVEVVKRRAAELDVPVGAPISGMLLSMSSRWEQWLDRVAAGEPVFAKGLTYGLLVLLMVATLAFVLARG